MNAETMTELLVTLRAENARLIPEYWLIDPTNQTITVLVLPVDADRYAVRGVHAFGQAVSECLPGFVIDVQGLFAQTR